MTKVELLSIQIDEQSSDIKLKTYPSLSTQKCYHKPATMWLSCFENIRLLKMQLNIPLYNIESIFVPFG